MKPKYDFSKAERGKFYRPEAKFNTPIYLDKWVCLFSRTLAMEATRVQEVIGLGTWEEKNPALWIYQSSGNEGFYYSIEFWQSKD